MTRQEHIKQHKELHEALDELLADFAFHTKKTFVTSLPIIELMNWAYEQTKNPTEKSDADESAKE